MAGILPFGAVFIELFFILSVSKHDFSIKKYVVVGPEKIILYGSISQGLETTKFTNLIG